MKGRASGVAVVFALACGAACKAPAASLSAPVDAAAHAPTVAQQGPGCSSSADCASYEYCDFEPGLCGHGVRSGECRPRDGDCDPAFAPVCGCDGAVHPSACEARQRGVDLAVNGGCKETPHDWIPCGARYCDARTTYCELVLSDVAELPTDYTCKPLPDACRPDGGMARACDCFPTKTRCASFCGLVPTGGGAEGLEGFHLTCRR